MLCVFWNLFSFLIYSHIVLQLKTINLLKFLTIILFISRFNVLFIRFKEIVTLFGSAGIL